MSRTDAGRRPPRQAAGALRLVAAGALLGGVCGLGLAPTQAVAQAVPGAGDIQRLPERFEPPPEPLTRPDLPAPGVARPDTAPPPGVDQVRFTLRRIVLAGNTVIATDALAPLWQDGR